MFKKTSAIILALILSVGLNAAASFAGDVEAGAKYYKKKCKSCHGKLVEGGKHATGPALWGVTTRVAGKAEGFKKYSKGLAAAEFKWTDDKLDEWLKKPKKFIKKAKMAVKVKKEADRVNLIEYLKTAK